MPIAEVLVLALIFYRLLPMVQALQQDAQQLLHMAPAAPTILGEGIKYAIRLPANRVLQERIGLSRVGRPPITASELPFETRWSPPT